MMESSTGDSDQDAVLDVVLSALFYGIGERKPLTRNTLKLIEESKPALGEANSLLVEGVLQLGLFQGSGESVVKRYFIKAEEKGCNHSILYHYLGECYYKGKMGIARNVPIALEYYTRAIAGTFLSPRPSLLMKDFHCRTPSVIYYIPISHDTSLPHTFYLQVEI